MSDVNAHMMRVQDEWCERKHDACTVCSCSCCCVCLTVQALHCSLSDNSLLP